MITVSDWAFTAVRVNLSEVVVAGRPSLLALLLLPLLCALGLLGNAFVCVAIATERRLHNVTNYFLFSLALADLLVCSVVMPLTILVEVDGVGQWSFPMCLLYVYSDVFLCSASIVHMSVISLDRYLGISQPLKQRNKSRSAIVLKILFVWITTVLISSPLAVAALLDHSNILILHSGQCGIFNRYYMIYGSTLSFLIPFAIMAVTYVKTSNLLRQQAAMLTQRTDDRMSGGNGLRRSLPPQRKYGQFRRQQSTASATSNGTAPHKASAVSFVALNKSRGSLESDELLAGSRQRIERLRRRTSGVLVALAHRVSRGPTSALSMASQELANEHKATRVLALVFLCFFICWTPFFVNNFASGFCGNACSAPESLEAIFLWLGYTSSTLNPIIYTVFNRVFRRAFLRIVRCQCCGSRRRDNSLNYVRQLAAMQSDAPTWSYFERVPTTVVANRATSDVYWRRTRSRDDDDDDRDLRDSSEDDILVTPNDHQLALLASRYLDETTLLRETFL